MNMETPEDFRRIVKPLDRKYIDNGIIKEHISSDNDCTIRGYSLSKLGKKYALSLIVSLTAVNGKLKAPVECYANVKPFKMPKGIMTEFPDKIQINQKGVQFVQKYMALYPFNQYIYDFAISMPDDMFIDFEDDDFDHRYIDNGIVKVVEMSEKNGKLVHDMQVTDFGWEYCMGLIVVLFAEYRHMNKKSFLDIPEGVIQQVGNGYQITPKGRDWFKDYILSHKYNDGVYRMITTN